MPEDRPVWGTAVVATPDGLAFDRSPSWLGSVIESAASHGARPFVIEGDDTWSFERIVERANAVAGSLAATGVGPGDRVGLLGANSTDWIVGLLGVLRAGAVAVLANGWWTGQELERACRRTEPRLVLADARRVDLLPSEVTAQRLDVFIAGASAAPTTPPGRHLPPSAPALAVFTSGTTTEARAAVLSHGSVIANLHNVLHRSRQLPGAGVVPPPPTSLCALPLFHLSGIQTLLTHLVSGGTLVLTTGRFDPEQVLDLVERHGVASWAAVPAMLTMVLDAAERSDRRVDCLRSLAVGGAPVPPALLARAAITFPNAATRLAHSYGSTEAGGTVGTGLRLADGSDAVTPLATVEVRIEAPGVDDVGEILVRSPALMDGYLGVPAEDQPIRRDGWLATGDLGRLDGSGNLVLIGRAKDVVIRGGENVSAAAVEAAVLEHAAVAEVAVVGAPHPVLGEEVVAVLRARPGHALDLDELAADVAGRLARFAVPSRWIVTDETLPVNASGKVSKDEVRALVARAAQGAAR